MAQRSLRDMLGEGVSSTWAIASQLGMLALLAAFVLVPWARILGVEREAETPAERDLG